MVGVVWCCAAAQAPSAEGLEDLLGRLPYVRRVVLVTPHGHFGQQGVLGLPDTGGQVRRRSGGTPAHMWGKDCGRWGKGIAGPAVRSRGAW